MSNTDEVRRQALSALIAHLEAQGHPQQYAQHMAAATIFQADLDLRNAQLSRLLAWLEKEQAPLYPAALALVEETRAEFERRVSGS